MTRFGHAYGGVQAHADVLRPLPVHSNLHWGGDPSYRNMGAAMKAMAMIDAKAPSLSDVLARETAELLTRRQRLSVRELAMKFEKGLTAATWLSDEVKWRQAALLERDVLLNNLRDILESLCGRLAGKNKDDVEDSISMVESLAVQLSHREAELLQQKTEVKKIAVSLKLASEDAKRIVEEERASCRTEVENAKAAVQRVRRALTEKEDLSRNLQKKGFEDLMVELQESRRIKMLHSTSKVMDMVNEIQALRHQHVEKSANYLSIRKELESIKKCKELRVAYKLEGLECLGSSLQIVPASEDDNYAVDVSSFSIRWYRSIEPAGSNGELISGANKALYVPEPYDVGRHLQAELISGDKVFVRLSTAGPIEPAPGLGSYVEALLRKPETEFSVIVVQENGDDAQLPNSIHVLNIGRLRMKLGKAKTVIAKEFYSSSMQLCGVRGGGNAAPQAVFWQVREGHHFILAFESARERNAAIMLARRFAADCNILLGGPGDRTAW